MHLPSLTAALLLPFLVMADSTTTSTSTMTKTITVLQVVATETMTHHNSTSTYASVGTVSAFTTPAVLSGTVASASPTVVIPANYMGAASSLNSRHVGGAAALVAMAIAAIL